MSQYMKHEMEKHEVKHIFSGQRHFYKVGTHDVSLDVNCDCAFMGRKGVASAQVCSHILAAMNKIVKDGQVKK